MKIDYRREFKHNYLIIDPEELCWQGYESQMLSRNSIEGVLRFKIRQMDQGVRFYYEITSKQPLARLLENRNIQAEEIRSLVIGIFGVMERAEQYLLREESILLDPRHLYVDPDTFRVWLCLVPGMENNFPEDFSKLLEYLLGSVDHQDKESVVLAYGLYQETRKENYGMEDLGRLLLPRQTQGLEKSREHIQAPDKNFNEEKRVMPLPSGDRSKEGADRSRRNDFLPEKEESRKSQRKKDGWSKKWNQWKESIFSGSNNKQEEIPVRAPWEMMFQEDKELIKDENLKIPLPFVREKSFSSGLSAEKEPSPQGGQGTELLADFSENKEQKILRSLDPGGQDIYLSYYPFIIGKQENLVDFKLDKDTVSRLHLRIDRDGDSYRIKDLNSTNGTRLCGRLLENNEEAELQKGDEICIARYRYRFE